MGEFSDDLKKGEMWENIMIKVLNTRGFNLKKGPEKAFYDLVDKNTNIKFEIKYDEMSMDTLNVAIEIGTKTNPAGITNTRATYWCHIWYSNNKLVCNIIPVYLLKQFLRKNRNRITIRHNVGDGNATVCLVSKGIFEHWGVHTKIHPKHLTNEKG